MPTCGGDTLPSQRVPKRSFKNEIMDITEAILDYCNTPAVVTKDACVDVDESDEDNETRDDDDDDSGIDRSDDFTQELINEL